MKSHRDRMMFFAGAVFGFGDACFFFAWGGLPTMAMLALGLIGFFGSYLVPHYIATVKEE
jgi:hypothetical protein